MVIFPYKLITQLSGFTEKLIAVFFHEPQSIERYVHCHIEKRIECFSDNMIRWNAFDQRPRSVCASGLRGMKYRVSRRSMRGTNPQSFADRWINGSGKPKNIYRMNTMLVWPIRASKSRHWISLANRRCCLTILKKTSMSPALAVDTNNLLVGQIRVR